ncbi:LysR family transcriptional regulator, partial [Klebsiella pneumoniae subsp. pneumoniae]
LMMSLWDALRMNMMISYQELVRTFPNFVFEYDDIIIFIFVRMSDNGIN